MGASGKRESRGRWWLDDGLWTRLRPQEPGGIGSRVPSTLTHGGSCANGGDESKLEHFTSNPGDND